MTLIRLKYLDSERRRGPDRNSVEWYLQRAMRRTVLVRPEPAPLLSSKLPRPEPELRRVDFPEMMFVVATREMYLSQLGKQLIDPGNLIERTMGAFTRLNPGFAPSRKEPLRVFGLNVQNHWRVCFGNVDSEVSSGGMDPFEAFWNTSFYDTSFSGERAAIDAMNVISIGRRLAMTVPFTPEVVNWSTGAGRRPDFPFDEKD